MVTAGGLSCEVRRLEDARALEDLGLNSVWVERDFQTPLLHVLRLRNHFVELADRPDTIVWLLEQGLAHSCHRFLVLAYLLGNTNQHAQFGRQIDILALLLDFE